MMRVKRDPYLTLVESGTTWKDFLIAKRSKVVIRNVRFRARCGLHLGQPMVALIRGGEYIAFAHLDEILGAGNWEWHRPVWAMDHQIKKLEPRQSSGYPFSLRASWPDTRLRVANDEVALQHADKKVLGEEWTGSS